MPYNTPLAKAITTNFKTGSIQISKPITKGTQFLKQFQETVISPFDESRNPAWQLTSREITGLNESIWPGFSSSIADKLVIPIDITAASERKIYKMSSARSTNSQFPEGSGFVYYNFQRKMWEDIGLRDPITNTATTYDYVFNHAGGYMLRDVNIKSYMCQFTPSPCVSISTSLSSTSSLQSLGYDKIGIPTSYFDAPNASRYHATSSQTLKLSNFISKPFVLEKIYVELPVIGTRTQDAQTSGPLKSGAVKDITNHVFFMYRQNRTTPYKDTLTDISSSIRSLVANESFCFFNSSSINGGNNPIHSAIQRFEHGQDLNTASVSSVTGSLKFTFRPRVYNQLINAVSMYPAESSFGTNQKMIGIQHYWAGGSKGTMIENGKANYSVSSDTDIVNYNTQVKNDVTSSENPRILATAVADPRPFKSSFWKANNQVKTNTFFTGSGTFNVGVTTDTIDYYRETPYILFPDDELIFGLDCGFMTLISSSYDTASFASTHAIRGQDNSFLNITGSYLTIPATNARILLYGSTIKMGAEKLPILNQKLTSNAIHETIHEEITDTYDTHERILNSGSYLDNWMRGSILEGNARRIKCDVSSSAYPFRRFNRFVTMRCFSERAVSLTYTHFTSVFNRNHFGHSRDMLEQRKDSKSINYSYVEKGTNQINFNKITSTVAVSSPAVCKFVSQSSDLVISASDTRSCNLSTEFTCSLPFFDGIAMNRSEISFNANSPFAPQTAVLNKASSLLSSTQNNNR